LPIITGDDAGIEGITRLEAVRPARVVARMS